MALPYKTRETMRVVQAPNVYAGETCDQHEPRWIGSAEGDKDGAGPVGLEDALMLSATTFPPGTIVTIHEPECPQCHTVPTWMGGRWECECDLDWRGFAEDHFS
ncbi:hypothetical protein [Roseovarius indicus]|uniref:Uncharacterized protein n=1 Tax=Roseovarius indicus TaxID=540747 RepID=A0A0T5P366_9RHOB|nr:hypothetical protein [Roseovarius indicus]KRS15634.1 hypothetical protein XM52_22600 [Roseovarius indicus]QEW27860.1 hypothetical protein RIdsm_03681 [Roseovarius indicus]SFE79094.1 hypothetical protein SAMN04488031_1226 [Roseovarius indicus]